MKVKKIFENIILHKYQVSYFQCPKCAAVYIEKPNCLDEAYSDAIVASDVGIMQLNIQNCVIVNKIIVNKIIKKYIDKRTYLDAGVLHIFKKKKYLNLNYVCYLTAD